MLRPRTFTVDRLVLLRVHAQPAQHESTSTCKSMAQLHVRKVIRRSKSQHDRSCANQVPQQVFAPSDTLPCPGSHIPTQLFCRPVHTTTTFQLQSCTQSALSELSGMSGTVLTIVVAQVVAGGSAFFMPGRSSVESMCVCDARTPTESPLRRSGFQRKVCSVLGASWPVFEQHFFRKLRHERLTHFVSPYDQQIIDICPNIHVPRFVTVQISDLTCTF